jgi:hypothetical protein
MEKVTKQMAIQRVKKNAQIYQHPKTSEDEKKENNSTCTLQQKF